MTGPGVRPECLPRRLAHPRHHVEHSVRQPRLAGQLGHPQRAQRRQLGRLDHDAVPGGQRRSRLPRRQHCRKVPRQDSADDPDRLPQHQPDRLRTGRCHRTEDLVRRLGVPAEGVDRLRQIHLPAIRDRFPGLQRVQERQLTQVDLHQVSKAQQHALALGRRVTRPPAVLERAPRRPNSQVDVCRPAGRDLAQRLTRRGVLGHEPFAGHRLAEPTTDKHTATKPGHRRQRHRRPPYSVRPPLGGRRQPASTREARTKSTTLAGTLALTAT